MPRHAFIICGTGQIGRKIAEALPADGWAVTASRARGSPEPADLLLKGAKTTALDRNEDGALRQALIDGADAVIDTKAHATEHADQLIELGGSVAMLCVISSASMYQDHEGRTLDEAGEGGFPDFPKPIKGNAADRAAGSANIRNPESGDGAAASRKVQGARDDPAALRSLWRPLAVSKGILVRQMDVGRA
jgi:nucleoside-diphosphate-sugar epimerase